MEEDQETAKIVLDLTFKCPHARSKLSWVLMALLVLLTKPHKFGLKIL